MLVRRSAWYLYLRKSRNWLNSLRRKGVECLMDFLLDHRHSLHLALLIWIYCSIISGCRQYET